VRDRLNSIDFYVIFQVAVTLLCAVSSARASLVEPSLQKILLFSQTSAAAPTAPDSFGAYLGVYELNPGDVDSVTVAYPGPGSPVTLPGPGFVTSQYFLTQADMDAAYPLGTYTFLANNSVTLASETDVLNYAQDAYPLDIPALDPATFLALEGMNPSLPFTVDFNSFTQSPNANAGGGTYFVVTGGMSPFWSYTPDSAVIPANTLAFGATYYWGLGFDDQITSTDPSTGAPTLIVEDLETFGTFTTAAAAPEPSTLILAGIASLGCLCWRIRKQPRVIMRVRS
jgi:hypothetical protein